MEMFASFDDSVFLEARARVPVTLSAYDAKVCEPKWFCEAAALHTEDPLEKLKVYKFRGDLAVRRGNHQEALEAYGGCLQWVSRTNLTVRRDMLEGMARCCAQLGHRRRALDFANSLSKEVSNTCHLTSLLLLKVSIYQHFGAVGSKMSALQQLCSLLPFNPWHWYDLGQTCLPLLDSGGTAVGSSSPERCESSEEQNDGGTEQQQQEEEEEEEEELNENIIWLKACTCFIRTRLLLRILRQQQSSFVLRRAERALQTTEEALQRLSPGDSATQALTEVLSEDLIPDRMREDYQDGDSVANVCVQSFRERWWDKILLTGALGAGGRGTRAARRRRSGGSEEHADVLPPRQSHQDAN
ncbi:uncharacterized protein C8orf76 [Pseudoliparis swirei]|uniref:uncharacterized protein C8orf76 n=1 Tax=Pseudoliparis swirei TaxID=2059687 RepID=UPI0024BD95C9|nr:uncharacterized protein C8orf76 [Pseudoliparis swirei]